MVPPLELPHLAALQPCKEGKDAGEDGGEDCRCRSSRRRKVHRCNKCLLNNKHTVSSSSNSNYRHTSSRCFSNKWQPCK